MNAAGAISAIHHARERQRPFLGTCGGFQHAMLEYAQACWGVAHPAHAEIDPTAVDPLIVPLSCGLVEVADVVRFFPGSRLRDIYGCDEVTESHHCKYGLSANHTSYLADGPLRIGARDAVGELRAEELEGTHSTSTTFYQPERAGLAGRSHPLVSAFAAAMMLVMT